MTEKSRYVRKLKTPVKSPRRRISVRDWIGRVFASTRRKNSENKRTPLTVRAANWFDQKILMAISPGWAEKRINARGRFAMLSFRQEVTEAVLSGRFNSIARDDDYREDRYGDHLLSPDAGMSEDLEVTQIRARELYRSNNIAHSAIEGRVSHEVGEGIHPQSNVTEFENLLTKDQAKRIRKKIEWQFKIWSKGGVDESRQFSFSQFQRRVCREFSNMGEAFILFGRQPHRKSKITVALQLISAERVETPPERAGDPLCRMGVQYGSTYVENADGEWVKDEKFNAQTVTGYWVRTVHPGDDLQYEYKHKFYPRLNSDGSVRMQHLFEPLFPEQSRGLPWLACAANRLKDLDDYFESELIIKQVEACFGVIVRSADGINPEDLAASNASRQSESNPKMGEEDLSPGFVQYLNENEDITTVDPQRPGHNFAPFIEAALRSIAGALNYPYELLAKNFFRTTFSSGKLAMLDGKRGFKMRQAPLVEMFCTPVWEACVDDMVDQDLIPEINDSNYLEHPEVFQDQIWKGSPFGAIDEEKEVKSRKEAIESMQKTRTEIANEDGKDFFDDEDIRQEEELRMVETRLLVEKREKELREKYGLEDPEESKDESQTEEPAMAGSDA